MNSSTQDLILLLFLQTCTSSGFLSVSIIHVFRGQKGPEMLGLLIFGSSLRLCEWLGCFEVSDFEL